jgi:hypothetical protein
LLPDLIAKKNAVTNTMAFYGDCAQYKGKVNPMNLNEGVHWTKKLITAMMAARETSFADYAPSGN